MTSERREGLPLSSARWHPQASLVAAGVVALTLCVAGAAHATCYQSPYAACPTTNDDERSTLIPATAFPTGAEGQPMAFVDPGDGLGHRFVPLHGGLIKVWNGGTTLSGDFLDLSSRLLCCGERGLLALAFHPDYADNGFFYVMYTGNAPTAPGNDGDVVVQRFSRSVSNVDDADENSAVTVLIVSRPEGFANHNGGWLAFGPDGFLYISTGDGGNFCDTTTRDAQEQDSLRGKLLRIDVDQDDFPADSNRNYGIPNDNPFVGSGGADEVWTLGLRNPFRFSFDRANGDLFIGDVGQDNWEEINHLAASAEPAVNFGWVCREGCSPSSDSPSSCEFAKNECTGHTATTCSFPNANGMWDPVLCFKNDDVVAWTQIMGGYRYRGGFLPSDHLGRYYFTDAGNGKIWRTDPADVTTAACWTDTPDNPYGFGEDHLGELYYVAGVQKRIDCIHGGHAVDGCYWANWGGIFEDGFETHGTSHWSATQPP